jgi:hypothetical protein
MPVKAVCRELPIFVLTPPYRCFEPAGTSANLRMSPLGPGTVIALHLADPEAETGLAASVVRALRRSHPAYALAFRAPQPDLLPAARLATELGVRAVLSGSSPEPASIRRQLTDPIGMASHVVRWAADSGWVHGAHAEAELRVILEGAPNCRTLGELTDEEEVVGRTRRSRLQQLGLPSPRAWLNLGHELHNVLFLQRHPELSLQRAGYQLGFAEPAALMHRIRRVFGCRASEARRMLGCEPLLSLWSGRAANAAGRRRTGGREG